MLNCETTDDESQRRNDRDRSQLRLFIKPGDERSDGGGKYRNAETQQNIHPEECADLFRADFVPLDRRSVRERPTGGGDGELLLLGLRCHLRRLGPPGVECGGTDTKQGARAPTGVERLVAPPAQNRIGHLADRLRRRKWPLTCNFAVVGRVGLEPTTQGL